MADVVRHRGRDQGTAVGGVVAVVFQRVGHRLGNNDRSGEMHDGVDRVFSDQPADQGFVSDIAQRERHIRRDSPSEARRQIVQHDDAAAGICERQYGMAADIAGAAGDQDRASLVACHQDLPLVRPMCRRRLPGRDRRFAHASGEVLDTPKAGEQFQRSVHKGSFDVGQRGSRRPEASRNADGA